MPTPTTTYSLSKPTVGGDDNTWGTEINNNLDKLDDLLDGTLGITPNLATGWEVGGVAVTSTAAELNILDGVTASTAEINLLDGVTATTAELNYVDGVTSNIQTQLNAKQPLDADLTAIAALTPTADRVIIGNGTTWTTAELPSGGILAVNASAPLASSGGTSPTISLSGTVAVANGGTGATTAAGARTNLGTQATITGGATTITSSNLTASRALVSDGSGKVAVSAVTSTEVEYLDGVTSNIQTQLNGKAATTTQAQATWEAGTSTTETIVSPAKVKAAIDALAPTAITLYSATTSTLDSTTTVIPVDTSVPLSTEGKQALSISSVVVASGQKVKVSFSGMISNNTNNVVTTLAVFRDTTCIGTAVTLTTTANLVEIVGATIVDDPGVGTYTYSLRFGPQSNTAYLNANASGQAIFGTAGRTDLVIEVL